MMSENQTVSLQDYKDRTHFKVLIIAGLGVVLSIMVLVAISVGQYGLSLSEVVHYILHKDDSTESIIIWRWRMPIAIGTVVVGATLALAGTVMQCILKNPLASPYTLGLSSAAAFGASLGILATENVIDLGSFGPYMVTIFAFMWSMLATGFIILMAKYTSLSPEAMVLAGVAITSIFSASVSALQYFATDSALASIVYWQFGDVTKLDWTKILFITIILVICTIYFMNKRWDYNALDAGDETARCLGVDINATRVIGMVAASVVTSVAVSFIGVIGFVGLLGPHITRKILGSDHRFLIPGSMIVGALILLTSCIIAQNAFSFVMPVGIITSFLGGPLFLLILLKSYRKKEAL